MKKLTKLILSLALVLSVVLLPVGANAAETKGTANFANSYDWSNVATAPNNIYVLAGENAEATIEAFGFPPADFQWWNCVVLEQGSNGVYTVKAADMLANNAALGTETFGKGKVVIMCHSYASDAASYGFFTGLKAGDKISIDKAWADLAAATGATTVNFEYAKEDASTPSTTPDAGTNNNAGSNNAGSNNAGSGVPSTGDATPVVAMASMLFVAVACVALGLKKRNA